MNVKQISMLTIMLTSIMSYSAMTEPIMPNVDIVTGIRNSAVATRPIISADRDSSNSESLSHFIVAQLFETIQKIALPLAITFGGFMVLKQMAVALAIRFPCLIGPCINFLAFLYFSTYNAQNISALFSVMAGGAIMQYSVVKFIDYVTRNYTDIQSKDSAKQIACNFSNSAVGTCYALSVVSVASLAVTLLFWWAHNRFQTALNNDLLAVPDIVVRSAAAAAA